MEFEEKKMDEKELLSFKPAKASEIKLYFWAILCAVTIIGLPITIILLLTAWARIVSTQYRITNQRFFKQTGLIARHEEEIELFRIRDVKFHQGIIQRLFGIGNITVISSDATSPLLLIEGVHTPKEIKETLRTACREARRAEGVRNAEFLS